LRYLIHIWCTDRIQLSWTDTFTKTKTRKYTSDSMTAILKNRFDVISPPPIVLLLRNLQADAKWHADDYAQVEIESGNSIPIWRPSVFENGSSYISAVDWDISSKFGMQIDYVLPKQIPSSNPEVVFRLYGRHFEKSIWRHNSAADRPITTKFGREMQNDMLLTMHRSKSNPEIEFQYGGRPFNETASSFISAVD